ncbi:MAG: hypothetical protein D6758_09955 [Gammaproteobacteria bacterium]|nr:MAG: hypothetical protein D6758_09955 [Gammaproteobacteria bacterium]
MWTKIAAATLMVATSVAFAEKPVQSVELSRVAEKLRNHEIKIEQGPGMDREHGRFHVIHSDVLMLDCSTCHGKPKYREGVLNFSKFKPFPVKAKGQFEKDVCLGCHQEGGIATSFYTPSTTDE